MELIKLLNPIWWFEKVLNWTKRPKPQITFEYRLPGRQENHYCHRRFFNKTQNEGMFFRLGINNFGKNRIEEADVLVEKIEIVSKDGKREEVRSSPFFLHWANENTDNPRSIYRETPVYVDILYTDNTKHGMAFFFFKEKHKATGIKEFLTPGKWVLTVKLLGVNIEPVKKELLVDFNGRWDQLKIGLVKQGVVVSSGESRTEKMISSEFQIKSKEQKDETLLSKYFWKLVIPLIVTVVGGVIVFMIIPTNHIPVVEFGNDTKLFTDTTEEISTSTTISTGVQNVMPISVVLPAEEKYAITERIENAGSYVDPLTGLIVALTSFYNFVHSDEYNRVNLSITFPEKETETYSGIAVGRPWKFNHNNKKYQLLITKIDRTRDYIEISITEVE
jgi:hypothetical protein